MSSLVAWECGRDTMLYHGRGVTDKPRILLSPPNVKLVSLREPRLPWRRLSKKQKVKMLLGRERSLRPLTANRMARGSVPFRWVSLSQGAENPLESLPIELLIL